MADSVKLMVARPEILNSDQGVQFTCQEFTRRLESEKIQISMDGRGGTLGNVFIQRLGRSVKYEEVYLKDYTTVPMARENLVGYFEFSIGERRHQSLGDKRKTMQNKNRGTTERQRRLP